MAGLGLLDLETTLAGNKTLVECHGHEIETGTPVRGYEMHMGITSGPATEHPLLRLADKVDGARSEDGRIMGCYLHGLFAQDEFRRVFLQRITRRFREGVAYEAGVERALDDLADHLGQHLDLDAILEAASNSAPVSPRASRGHRAAPRAVRRP